MEAISLNNLHRNTQNIRNAHRAHLAEHDGSRDVPMELDPMHLGDVNNNYSVQPTRQNSALKTAALIGVGLLIGPVGAYYASSVIDAFSKMPPVERQLEKSDHSADSTEQQNNQPANPNAQVCTDNDTLYELDIAIGDNSSVPITPEQESESDQ